MPQPMGLDALDVLLTDPASSLDGATRVDGPPPRLAGRATILGAACAVEALLGPDGRAIAVCARPDPAGSWPFATAFPDMPGAWATDAANAESFFLRALSLEHPLLLLTAPDTGDVAGLARSLAALNTWQEWQAGLDVPLAGHAGLSLFGNLALGGPLEAVLNVLGPIDQLQSNLVRVTVDRDPLVQLSVEMPVRGTVTLGPLSLTLSGIGFDSPAFPSWSPSSVTLRGSLSLLDHVIEVDVALPTSGTAGDNALLVATGRLHAANGVLAPSSGIDLPDLSTGEVLDAEVHIDAVARRVERLRVGLHRDTWAAFDDALQVRDAHFTVSVDDPLGDRVMSAAASAEIDVADIKLRLNGFAPPWRMSADLVPGSTVRLRAIAQELGIPDDVLPDVDISELSFDRGITGDGYSFHLALEQWAPTPGLLQLETVRLRLVGPHPMVVEADARLQLSDLVELDLAGRHGPEGWSLRGATAPGQSVGVGALIQKLASVVDTEITLPEPLDSLTLRDVGVAYDQAQRSLTIDGTASMTVAGAPVDLTLQVHSQAANNNTLGSVEVVGVLTVSGHHLTVKSSSGKGTAAAPPPAFVMSYAHDPSGGGALDVRDVITFLFPDVADLVPSVTVRSAMLVRASVGRETTRRLAWLVAAELDADVGVDLAAAGVPGLSSDNDHLRVDNLRLVVSSIPLLASEVTDIGSAVSLGIPDVDVPGVVLAASLQIAGEVHDVVLPVGSRPADTAAAAPEQPSTATPSATPPPIAAAPIAAAPIAAAPIVPAAVPSPGQAPSATGSATPPAGATWLAVRRREGPLYVEGLGLRFASPRLELVVTASVSVGSLTLALDGLSIGIPLGAGCPSVDLAGLGLAFSAGAIGVSGALSKVEQAGQPVRYDGTAVISGEGFRLSALGSYTTVGGDPSLWVFALLDRDLGGPSFFFVTGLAAGFGWNRRLVLPDVDGLPSFPLVAMAISPPEDPPDPVAALANSAAIEVAKGELWFAAGVRFTSFQLVRSFALLTVSIGDEAAIDLLGISTLELPTEIAEHQEPIASARLVERVSFRPERGVLTAAGKLTPDSFLFSKACRLTGGFAFSSWFRDQPGGANAGDFVLSIGGYHPHFVKPSHYPDVSPAGYSWQIGDLSITGRTYAALTPAVVMAGSSLEAVWHGGGVTAWFSAHADFLLSWKPFHYEVDVGITLGASFTIDLWLVSFTISVSLGVNLQLWGPPFGGTATVDLSVISFTIGFGEGRPEKMPIPWKEFKDSFLPPLVPSPGVEQAMPRLRELFDGPPNEHDNKIPADDETRVPDVTSTETYCSAHVLAGLERELDGVWAVNAVELEIVTRSVIPIHTASFHAGGQHVGSLVDLSNAQVVRVDVGPSSLSAGDFGSHHVVALYKLDAAGHPVTDFEPLSHLDVTPVHAHVPRALWSIETAMKTDASSVANLNSQPSPLVENVLVGFSFKAKVVTDANPLEVPIEILQSDVVGRPLGRSWSRPPTAPPAPAAMGSIEQVTSTMGAAQPRRRALLAALGSLVPADDDGTVDERVSVVPDDLGLVLRHAPLITATGSMQ